MIKKALNLNHIKALMSYIPGVRLSPNYSECGFMKGKSKISLM